MKEKTIKLSELKQIYNELCAARKPRVEFDLNNEYGMARQAIFVKDKAIDAICNFLYNQGIQNT